MKTLKEQLINESQTKSSDIENYGKNFLNEWGPDYCGNILSWYIKGVKTAIETNKSDDVKFQKRCEDCIDELLKIINEKIY